jgi:hypothetical protein
VSWTTSSPDASGAASVGAPRAHGGEHHVHLPAGAHVGDRRGLTATGAVVVAFALGLVGAVIDLKTGTGLRTAFEVAFVIGTALAAGLVHREDLKAAVVLAPYTYCGLAVVAGVFGRSSGSGSFLKRSVIALTDAVVLNAPVLFLATGMALVIVLVRRARYRRP